MCKKKRRVFFFYILKMERSLVGKRKTKTKIEGLDTKWNQQKFERVMIIFGWFLLSTPNEKEE